MASDRHRFFRFVLKNCAGYSQIAAPHLYESELADMTEENIEVVKFLRANPGLRLSPDGTRKIVAR